MTRRSWSSGWTMVMSPSAHAATRAALSTDTTGASSFGCCSGQVPEPGPVDGDEAVVADLLAGEQAPDDVDALVEPLVAQLLAGPAVAGDVLVARLAAAERHPEPTLEHLRRGSRSSAPPPPGGSAGPGALTQPIVRFVVASAAPSQAQV